MSDLKTIGSVQAALKEGSLKASDLVSENLRTIEEGSGLNAFRETFNEHAHEQAAESDKRVAIGEMRPLEGVTFGIKDCILVNGEESRASSKILEGHRAVYDATAVARLREAGAIFVGTTNMDEFAMGSSSQTCAYGVVKNPLDKTRVPGGSSGGSAASVAANMSVAALGSDTAGSIRLPASFCGAIGFKGTYGSVSRYGLMAMASSLDHIGPITNSVSDAEAIFGVISGKDRYDSTSQEFELRHSDGVTKDDITVGIVSDLDLSGLAPDVIANYEAALAKIKELGYKTKEIKLPNLSYSVPCYYVIMPAEVSSNLARYDGVRYGKRESGGSMLGDYMETRHSGFGDEARRRIVLGTYVLSSGYYDAYYYKAIKVRELIRQDFRNAFNEVDAIVMPTTADTAFKIGEKMDDPVKMYLEDVFTVPADHVGVPALSVPSGTVNREGTDLPLSVQFMSPHFREDIAFRLGKDFNGE